MRVKCNEDHRLSTFRLSYRNRNINTKGLFTMTKWAVTVIK